MKFTRHRLASCAALGTLTLTTAHADIRVGDGTAESAAAGTHLPELVLIMWDRVAKVSYTKDLGVLAYSSAYASGDTSKNLFVYGQQDAGYQRLFPALNADANFRSFLAASSGVANQSWAILGAESSAEIIADAGSNTLFMTLTQDASIPAGGTNSAYADLTGRDANGNVVGGPHFENSQLGDSVGNFTGWVGDNNTNAANTSNTHRTTPDGSSFDNESSIGYAGKLLSGQGGALVSSGHGNVLNAVGRSSWFYRVTVSSDVSDASPAVDEFDNLGHDGYWGLGVDANNNYILSYTLDAYVTPTRTASGALLRLRTDYAASYGRARLIDVPAGAVTAVPEPATWGLMGLGLAVLAGRARRRA